MKNKQGAKLIESLQAIRQRPGLYIGPVDTDLQKLKTLITGVRVACDALGFLFAEQLYIEAAKERGYIFKSIYPDTVTVLNKVDGDTSKAIDELLLIEILVWEKYFNGE